ncbi:MAG TPA: RNA 2',3'-cyclic phosphodiesterase [Candidatus Marinimicrobia bacterium]|jgi:2'-5' RNA ligase|nr:RNA 2',3'-cyclic phosphodiesterase [Candidatus Neomarinimicrobiota bacterium]|tara:strand:- start:4522 stop:5103 length:582 start_codon:yes stop_codon:yes gene_type:complete
MSDRLIRTFISVPAPAEVNLARDSLKDKIISNGAKINWIRKDNHHFTLKFIGDMPEDDADRVSDAISRIIQSTTSIDLEIAGTGCFPKKERPRILWMGVQGDLKPLQSLVKDINEALDPLGYPKEEKKYIPHLTIARIRYPQKTTPDVSLFLDTQFEPIPFSINKIHFMRSELFFKGSVYTILDTHFLTKINI